MTPVSINYKGGVITWWHEPSSYGFRADVAYQTIGTYKTLAAAKAALTRDHKAWRRQADADHRASIAAIWAK